MDDTSPASVTLASPLGAAGGAAGATNGPWLSAPAGAAPASAVPPPSASSSQLPSAEPPDLRATSLYLNRELSWLEFNARVLAEAESETVPLLERLKFHAIVRVEPRRVLHGPRRRPQAAAHRRGGRDGGRTG